MTATEPELRSLVIVLQPLQHRPHPPRWWGAAVRFLILKVIGLYDASLESALHDSPELKPFTVSSLLGLSARNPLDPRQVLTLRLTAMQYKVADIFQQAVSKSGPLSPGSQIELDRIPFLVIADLPDTHAAWNRSDSYRLLAGRYLLTDKPPADHITLNFASPTGFKSGEKYVPFPMPELVFGSLFDRWNAFSPQVFSPEILQYVSDHIAISRYELHSRSTPGKADSLFIGGLGEVTYTTLAYDRYWMSLLQTLADFALYAGVGKDVTAGQGQCWNLNN